MKKAVLLSFILGIFLAAVSPTFAVEAKLQLFCSPSGDKYLANENGKLVYSLAPPFVSVNFSRDTLTIHPHVYYSPGTDFYDTFYDGFNVVCGGHPRSGIDEKFFYFGPLGGEFTPPPAPFEYCAIEAWIVDSDGVLFKTKSAVIHYSREVRRKR